MNRRLGCFTASGLLAAILTVLIVTGVSLARGGVLFSPGALNAQAGAPLGGVTSHAETGGRCKLCHAAFWQSGNMDDRCVACHTDVGVQLADLQSLHGALNRGNPRLPCRACHSDHNGPATPLTVIGSFSHEALGYSLQGHARRTDGTPFTCADCHTAGFSSFQSAGCETCHRQDDPAFMDAHVLAFGGDCLACHDGVDTYGAGFDHARYFPLTGKHTPALCGDCHLGARSRADLQAAPADCASCHAAADAHAGSFGTNCAACHTAEGWKPATFDHSLSTFPLTGAHARVECSQCHRDNVFQGTPGDCAACHPDPAYHLGLFGTACAQCHNTSAWAPASFSGAHTFPTRHGEAAACRDCHTLSLSAWTCDVCHAPAEMQRKHYEEGISNYTDCLRCHPTGREEGGGND
jgi:hypothetical protein